MEEKIRAIACLQKMRTSASTEIKQHEFQLLEKDIYEKRFKSMVSNQGRRETFTHFAIRVCAKVSTIRSVYPGGIPDGEDEVNRKVLQRPEEGTMVGNVLLKILDVFVLNTRSM